MAAGSTEAFASASQTLGCFNSALIKSDQDKFWSAEVMATASTGSFWEDDPEEEIKKKVNELKRKFHSGRQLQIKHLPRDVTEEEIRELLADFPVASVQLQCGGTGSGVARASLEDPEMLEEWDRERCFLLRGQRVPVAPTPTDMVLCVARLPPALSDAHFADMVAAYGPVRAAFLMISEKTGESKGYGFVEYTTKEAALQAKNMLDGKQIDKWILCCDWLDSNHVTFESLHSKCLYVDRLPKDFRDMGEFRKIFSSVVNPPYCQIALKNGCPQDWGLVEYNTSEDAETAQVSLNGYCLRGQNIRICYYIPGVRAINLYLKLLNDSGNKNKTTALLPDPPAPAVFQQLQNLAKQNPVFAQSLHNIIWTQIQNLQNGENGKKVTNNIPQMKGKPAVNGTSQPVINPGVVSPSPNTPGSTSPVLGNDNAQAALVILLAAQMQAQMGNSHPSLLGNPQMLATLQNLIKQSPPTNGAPTNLLTPMGPPAPPPPPPPPHYQFPPPHNGMPDLRKNPISSGGKNGFIKPGQPQKVPLLPNPSTAISPPPGEVAPHPPFPSPSLDDASGAGILGMPHLASQIPITDQTNFWNGLLGQLQNPQPPAPPINLGTLDPNLLSKGAFFEHNIVGPKSPLHNEKSNGAHFSQPVTPNNNKVPHPHTMKQNGSVMGYPESVSGDLQLTMQTINKLLSNAQNLNQLLGSLTSAIQTSGNTANMSASPRPVLASATGFPFLGQPGPILPNVQAPPPSQENGWGMPVPSGAAASARTQQVVAMTPPQAGRPVLESPVPNVRQPILSTPVSSRPILGSPVPVPVPTAKPLSFLDVKPSQLQQSPFQTGWAPGPFLASPSPLPPSSPQFGAYPGSGFVHSLWSHPGSPILIASPPSGLVTPVGQKRKYNRLLPSPEPSPEGNYIGQHSQGLGGHYADSYFKRKKKN